MHRFIEKNLKRCLAFVLIAFERVCRALGMKKYCRRCLKRLVYRTGLFDGAYYLENNPDVAADGYDPLEHYLAYGDKENRFPMPLFDPAHYRRNAGRFRPGPLNTLIHYSLIGRFEGYATGPWFDSAYYLSANRDVKFKGVDPLSHFMQYGGPEGRSPCATFDSNHYLLSHPDVADAGVNPLLHHLGCVQTAGATIPGNRSVKPGRYARTRAPAPSQWAALPRQENSPPAVVDVIIPVHKGRVETLRCIFNVLRYRQQTPFELVVINDASPDGRLSAELEHLAEEHLFTYIENESNIGYVRSVNLGMQRHPERDVVLLNADTEPCNDWLDRLQETARANSRTATVTPLSNNATICSYPVFDHDNPCPLEVSSAQLDRLARKVNAGDAVEAPTAVGFCMYIKRKCLDDIGLFDESVFGLGYGEENDFCQRAIRHDWTNVIAPNIYVWHWGARSFKGAKGRRIRKALNLVRKRYPNYPTDVAAFVADDPLRAARQRLDEARFLRSASNHNVLLVTHNRGGGTERSVRAHGRRLRRSGANLFFLTSSTDRRRARLSSEAASHLPNLDPVDFRIPGSFIDLLNKYRINEVHIHQLVDFDPAAAPVIAKCANAAGVRLEVFIHDYQFICPRINLVDSSGLYCGEPDESVCNACLKKKMPGDKGFKHLEIHKWRRRYQRLLTAAAVVTVPDKDVAIRLRRWFPGLKLAIRPPQSLDLSKLEKNPCLIRPDDPLRIVVIGAIVPIKGFHVLKACARDAQRRHLPLEFVVMGYSKNDGLLARFGVKVTGRYWDREALAKLQSLSPGIVWLPYIWPETYSYTLSMALSVGADVAAFDLGAIARRLRAINRGEHLHPLAWARQPVRINNYFVRFRSNRIREGAFERSSAELIEPMPRIPG
jgi:GT2 family glycosyltransferase